MAPHMDVMASPPSSSHSMSYVLGFKELEMDEHEGFQISFIVFYISGSVKSFIWSYLC